MASVYVASGKAEPIKRMEFFYGMLLLVLLLSMLQGGKTSIVNLQSDFRVDARFSNHQIEE